MPLRIAFYAPFKPLGHVLPSGDLSIAQGLFDYLGDRGHTLVVMSRLRARWIYWKPWRWAGLLVEMGRVVRRCRDFQPDLWLTYHTYYKSPDVLGPYVAKQVRVPYVVFQGVFSTKRRRSPRTYPGYVLNRRALMAALQVFANKKVDLVNLQRLLSPQRLTYVRPGIELRSFAFDESARRRLRGQWKVGDVPVVMSAAMFRPGVKTQSLAFLIRSCGLLAGQGERFRLVIAGDGESRGSLETLSRKLLGDRVRFLGMVPRASLREYLSAADLFAHPGIGESFGMVYLEAQCVGLPVVAFRGRGTLETIGDGVTGFLSRPWDSADFSGNLSRLIGNGALRRTMGEKASQRVRETFDMCHNYRIVESTLWEIAQKARVKSPYSP